MNRQRHRPALVLGLVWAISGCSTTKTFTSADGKVGLTQVPMMVQKRYFDRAVQFPSEVSTSHNQSANTNWDFHCRPRFQFDLIEEKTENKIVMVKIRVKSAQLEISAPITIYIPTTAKPEVISHEDGHVNICKKVYESAGSNAALHAGQAIIGHEFRGSGKTVEEAVQLALNRAGQELGRSYRAETVEVVNRVSNYYDQFAPQQPQSNMVDTCVEAAFQAEQGRSLKKVE